MNVFIQRGVDILTTTVNKVTGKILAQTGNVVGEVTDTDNVEWWQHYGFASRPPKPTAGKKAAQALVMEDGGHCIALASQDTRCLEIYGNIDHGEACVYSAGDDGLGQARTIWKKDGSVSDYTTDDNTKDGQAVYFRTAPDGFSWVAPWGTIKFDATGLHINHASGAQLSLGGIGLPSPVDMISSYIRMVAGSLNVSSTNQSFGGQVGHEPLASATKVMAAIAALQTQITAIQGALATLTAGPLAPVGAAIVAIQPVTAPAASAIAAATAPGTSTIPTSTAST